MQNGYKSELNAIFKRHIRGGFVDWRQCGNLECEVTEFLNRAANELLPAFRDKELFDLVCHAYLKWGKTDKDDSSGETQEFVYGSAFILWDKIYEREHPDIPHSKMFEWFLKKMDGSIIDYMEDMLFEYVMSHFSEPNLLKRKLDFLNKRIIEKEEQAKEKSWKIYDVYRCKNSILQIYGEQKRPIEEIRAYAKDFIRNDSKEILANIELSYGNRDEGLKLFKELVDSVGTDYDPKDYNGKLKDLYKQFQLHEEYAAQVEKLLRIKTGNKDIWMEYKSLVPAEDWEEHVNKLFSTFSKQDCRPLPWYQAENRYDLIMAAVESDGPLYLSEYEEELHMRYPKRCLNVLIKAADHAAENGSKRKDYRYIAKYLKWMRKYPGGAERAAELADIYRKTYPRRSAMIDELKGI